MQKRNLKKSPKSRKLKNMFISLRWHINAQWIVKKGKTYDKAGSCPVCKMDLKAKEGKHGMTCKQHKDGNCTCEGEKCECVNCAEHSKEMTCKQHKDGKCSCKGQKCKCENCKEHAQAMTCEQHKDGKCTCEGEKCECKNCSEHA